MSVLDWDLFVDMPAGGIEQAPTFGKDRGDRPPPRKDVAGQPNPFVLGTHAVIRYHGMFDECPKAAAERPATEVDIKVLSASLEH